MSRSRSTDSNIPHRTRGRLALTAIAIAASGSSLISSTSCTGSHASHVIPTLPRDGDSHTDAPQQSFIEKKGQWDDPSQLIGPPPRLPAHVLTLPPSETFTLKNGLEVILVADPRAPMTSFQLAIKAGRERGHVEKVGLARLAAIMMTRGTRSKNAAAVVGAIEAAGGNLTADASYEATLLSCNVLSTKAATCTTILADMVSRPTFPQAAFTKLKTQLREAANQQIRDPAGLASSHLQNALWGKASPRGWPTSQRTINAITRTDVINWHRTFIRPNNAILAVSGDFDSASIKKSIQRRFRHWAKGNVPPRAVMGGVLATNPPIRVVDKPDEQIAHIRIGQAGISDADNDFFPTLVVNAVLGELPQDSRIGKLQVGNRSIRAQSQLDRNRDVGSWLIQATPPAEETVSAIQQIRDAMTTLHSSGPSEEEMLAAKVFLTGKYSTRFQSISDVTSAILVARMHGFDSDRVTQFPLRIDAVSRAAAAQAAKRRLDPDNLVIVIVGPARIISPQLKRAGWKHEVTSYINPVAPWEREANDADARSILAEALKAKGGKERLANLKTFEWSGNALLVADQKMKAKVNKKFVMPDQLRLEMNIPSQKATIVTVMSGDVGWAQQITAQGNQSVSFPKAEVAAGKAQIWRDQDLVLLRYLEKGADVTLVDEISIDGAKNWAVRIISNDKRYSVVLYINQTTKLLSGMTYQERGRGGKVIVAEERYSNYKKVSGLQIAHKRTTRSAQVNLTTEIYSIEINKPIDAKVFIKPAQ